MSRSRQGDFKDVATLVALAKKELGQGHRKVQPVVLKLRAEMEERVRRNSLTAWPVSHSEVWSLGNSLLPNWYRGVPSEGWKRMEHGDDE